MVHSGKTKVAGILGWPVSHSLSPQLHGFWLDQYDLDGAYIPLPVRPEDIRDVLQTLGKLGLAGGNVTVPHKEDAFRVVDHLSAAAQAIGAVNTLIIEEDGSLFGDNTDGYGFIENMKRGAPKWNPKQGTALVLGAGGAARAVIWALLEAGVPEIILSNRTKARAEDLAEHFGERVSVSDWADRNKAIAGKTVLVNTTTLGMEGKPTLDIDVRDLSDDAVVTDIVYTPLQTQLLVDASARGLTTVDGLGMLLHQAVPGFEAWFGVRPDVTDSLRYHVLAARDRA